MIGKMNLMENIILGWWTSREIPHSMTIYFILGGFIKSSVTSDYNELNVSVTHVAYMILYLTFLCILWPPWLSELWGLHIVYRLPKKYLFLNVDQRSHCHFFSAELILRCIPFGKHTKQILCNRWRIMSSKQQQKKSKTTMIQIHVLNLNPMCRFKESNRKRESFGKSTQLLVLKWEGELSSLNDFLQCTCQQCGFFLISLLAYTVIQSNTYEII